MPSPPEQSAETFSALLALIQQGNSDAELQLVSQFHKGLYYAMRHRIGDSTLAEDICQETWRILLEKFREHGATALLDAMLLPSYIHNTALNVFLAEQRRNQRRQTETDSDLLLEVADEGSGDFVDQLATSRIQKRVREVIDGMNNARDKLVLYRYYIQEQSKEQICRDLGLDYRHFDRVAHRARERLRKAVEDTAGDLHQEVGYAAVISTTLVGTALVGATSVGATSVGATSVEKSGVNKQDVRPQDIEQQDVKQAVSKGH